MKRLARITWLMFLLSGVSWGAIGDVWDLAGDWNAAVNGATVVKAGGGRGRWTYHNGAGTAYTVAQLNNFPSELPPNNGWCGTTNTYISLNRFTADAVGLKTNYKTGEVGGHTETGATWTSLDGGSFKVNGWGFQARIQGPPNVPGELGRNQNLYYADAGVSWTLQMDAVVNNGSANALHIPERIVTLTAGQSITFEGKTGPGGVGDWIGLSLTIQEIEPPPPPLPLAHLAGDINRDDCVNLEDMAALAGRWLEMDCALPQWCEGSDIDRSGAVDLGDFGYVFGDWDQCYVALRHLGYVVISMNGPTDGGDFGNNTPGTQTGGWQEALNYAVANHKDVFAVGGLYKPGVGGPVVYFANTTIYVPAAEHLRVTGGDYVLNWSTGPSHCMVFDSLRDCSFKLGLLVAQGPGIQNGYSMMRMRPTTALSDGYVGIKNCQFSVSCPVGGGSVWGQGYQGKGTGLELDGTSGPIEHNRFYFMEFNACQTGMHFKAGDIRNNWIISPFTHICNNLLLMETGRYNRIDAWLEPGGVGNPVLGANLQGGEQNLLRLDFPSGMGGGTGLIFGPSARDNVVYATNLTPDEITNNSTASTNQVISNEPVGYALGTPAVAASGNVLQVRAPYRIVATITDPGNVQYWASWDADQQGPLIDGPLYRGQVIYLQPGDYVGFVYTTAPSWTWRALRME